MVDKNSIEELADRFSSLFEGRRDAWGTVAGACVREPVLTSHFIKHLTGKTSIGIYPLLDGGMCNFSAMDFDFKEHANRIEISEATARKFGEKLFERGLRIYFFERSKSGLIHLILLFSEPVPAWKIRKILLSVAKELNLTIRNGVVEIFPKQDRTSHEKGVGNYINAPYFGALNGNTETRTILDPHTFKPIPLEAFLNLAEQRRITLLEVDEVFDSLPDEEKETTYGDKTTYRKYEGEFPVNEIVEIMKPYYKHPNRQELMLALMGYIGNLGRTKTEAEEVMLRLIEGNNDQEPDEPEKRRTALDGTFERIEKGLPVEGHKGLKRILEPEDLAKLDGLFEQSGEKENKAENEQENTEPITLAEVKTTFNKWLLLSDDTVIEVALSTVVANYYLESDPLWLQIISPSSGCKTEILRALDGAKDVHYLSTFTKATLISGLTAKVEPSLLLRLKHHILVLKDFTSVTEMNHYDKGEVMSQLREIFDGQFSKSFGTGKTIKWEGHLGFIAGCTPVIDGEILLKQLLGERFILYRMNHEDRKTIALRGLQNNNKEKVMRRELKEAFRRFLSQFDGKGELPSCDDETKNKIVALADITSLSRSSVPREGTGDKVIKYVPDPELPPRVAKQFHLLVCSLAKVRGKSEVTEEELKVIQKVSLDCIPKQRRIAIHALLVHAEDWQTTRVIAKKMKYPVSTTRLILEDLHVLGLCDRRFEGGRTADDLSHNTPYEWQIDGEFYNTIDEACLGEKDFE